MRAIYFLIICLALTTTGIFQACTQPVSTQSIPVKVGAERLEEYLPLLTDKKVGLLVNHTSYIGQKHLLDTLLSLDINVKKIFAPEHGFRGNKANGEEIIDGVDQNTGLPVISLYGKNKKPSQTQLEGLDIVIYDIQDVGARFYTYISSMHYMMKACAAYGIKMMILDRPNPNGDYIDGPIMNHQSFVGMHPIPIVYGMTSGELAQMIVGENWLDSQNLDLTIIKLSNWSHNTKYELPIAPSPNLPNYQSIRLYPSLCLFEGTNVSVGRGTSTPFQIVGIPDSKGGNYTFTPISSPGYSKYPKHENEKCYGIDLRNVKVNKRELDLSYLISFYQLNPTDFFNTFFINLAGTKTLQQQIESGMSQKQIKASWKADLDNFKVKRKPYLLYP